MQGQAAAGRLVAHCSLLQSTICHGYLRTALSAIQKGNNGSHTQEWCPSIEQMPAAQLCLCNLKEVPKLEAIAMREERETRGEGGCRMAKEDNPFIACCPSAHQHILASCNGIFQALLACTHIGRLQRHHNPICRQIQTMTAILVCSAPRASAIGGTVTFIESSPMCNSRDVHMRPVQAPQGMTSAGFDDSGQI